MDQGLKGNRLLPNDRSQTVTTDFLVYLQPRLSLCKVLNSSLLLYDKEKQ